jgi:MFS family permease
MPNGETRTARLALALLLSINLLNYVDRYVLASLVPQIGKTLFGPHAQDAGNLARMGLLGTAFLVSYMLAAPLFGWLSDHISRWLLIGVSVAVWSLATGGSGLAGSFVVLLMMRCFVGVGEAGYGPSAPAIIADLFPVQRRGQVLAWFYVAIPVGSAMGYVLGARLNALVGWRIALLAVTVPGLLLASVSFFMTDPRDRKAKGRASVEPIADAKASPIALSYSQAPQPRWREYLRLLSNRSYMLDTLGMTALTFALGGMAFWMPQYLCGDVAHGGRGLPDSAKDLFGGILAVTGLLATLLGGLAGDKLRSRFAGSYFLVSAGGMFLAVPFIIAILYLPFPFAWVPLGLAIFFLLFNTGPTNAILANVTKPSVRATAFGLNILILHLLGDAASPPLLGAMAGRYGWRSAFYLVAAAAALSGVLWLLGVPYLEADTRRAEAATT